MGPWSRARCVRLTADENNAEVSTKAQKTRNTRPAPGLRTTAAEARSPRCDAPKHVSKTSSGSCSRAVETFIVLYSCPHCSTLPLGSQALCKVQLQMSRTALAQGFHDSWARLAASPRQLIGSTPQPRLASEEKAGNGATPLLERGQCVIHRLAASTNNPKSRTRLLMERQTMQPS